MLPLLSLWDNCEAALNLRFLWCSASSKSSMLLFPMTPSFPRIQKGLTGRITAPPGVHESGISSSAAVGVACLMALGHTNGLSLAPEEYIELDRCVGSPMADHNHNHKSITITMT